MRALLLENVAHVAPRPHVIAWLVPVQLLRPRILRKPVHLRVETKNVWSTPALSRVNPIGDVGIPIAARDCVELKVRLVHVTAVVPRFPAQKRNGPAVACSLHRCYWEALHDAAMTPGLCPHHERLFGSDA